MFVGLRVEDKDVHTFFFLVGRVADMNYLSSV